MPFTLPCGATPELCGCLQFKGFLECHSSGIARRPWDTIQHDARVAQPQPNSTAWSHSPAMLCHDFPSPAEWRKAAATPLQPNSAKPQSPLPSSAKPQPFQEALAISAQQCSTKTQPAQQCRVPTIPSHLHSVKPSYSRYRHSIAMVPCATLPQLTLVTVLDLSVDKACLPWLFLRDLLAMWCLFSEVSQGNRQMQFGGKGLLWSSVALQRARATNLVNSSSKNMARMVDRRVKRIEMGHREWKELEAYPEF